jgi:FKBP-type peptidyl-prolyl cis-trans isomerase 2
MMSNLGKRVRQENAIKRLEKTITMHEANAELTVAIMKEKELSTGSTDKVESVRKKKIERAKTTIQNTKKRMGN